jgi:hypothetical protein
MDDTKVEGECGEVTLGRDFSKMVLLEDEERF